MSQQVSSVFARIKEAVLAVTRNLSSLLLALALAVAVWVTAVTQEDPFEQRAYPNRIPISYTNLPSDLVIMGGRVNEAEITVRGPSSVLSTLINRQFSATVDLSSAEPGEFTFAVLAQVAHDDVRVVSSEPQQVILVLERLISREIPVSLVVVGAPAVGYEANPGRLSRDSVTISGPQSVVDSVADVVATVNITNLRESLNQDVSLQAVDVDGRVVSGVTLSQQTLRATVTIQQLGGYRDVAVRAQVVGQVASGYRVINIATTPPVVTVYSEDPLLVENLPGFVLTEPLNIEDARDDVSARLTLVLPEGVSLVGEQSVQVAVSVEALISSLLVETEIRVTGLGPGLLASVEPQTLVVILSGPLPQLERLTERDISVLVDVLGLRAGTYELSPQIVISVPDITVETVLPPEVGVIITAGTPTPTPRP